MEQITRKYEVLAMSNGYSIRIVACSEEANVVEHYVVGGTRSGTKTETLRKRIIGYALGELKEQLEKAIGEADTARPELPEMSPDADTD